MANKQRGYITVELGGKNRTLHFSMNFWAQWTDMLGVSLEQIGTVFEQGISLKGVRSLIYSGILTHDQEQGNEVDYNEFTVGSWLDDLEAEKLTEIINTMLESRILGNDLNMGIERKVKRTTKSEGK